MDRALAFYLKMEESQGSRVQILPGPLSSSHQPVQAVNCLHPTKTISRNWFSSLAFLNVQSTSAGIAGYVVSINSGSTTTSSCCAETITTGHSAPPVTQSTSSPQDGIQTATVIAIKTIA